MSAFVHWPQAAVEACLLFRRCQGVSRHSANCPKTTLVVESRCGAVALGRTYLFSASFVWRCLSGSTVTPFPHPARRTGQANLSHPALGQDFTLSRATPSAVSDRLSELIGFPISKVLPYVMRRS